MMHNYNIQSSAYGTFTDDEPHSWSDRRSSTLPSQQHAGLAGPARANSSTLPSRANKSSFPGVSQFFSLSDTTQFGEPLRDYVTELSTSYETVCTDSTRTGPTVAECVEELEEHVASALEEIKNLTEHRAALDSARCLEATRKQAKYVAHFLNNNYDITIDILNLRTRYLSIKFAFLSGMIEKLTNIGDSAAIAPSYLRIKTFSDWLKHSTIIDEIQDKMLKVRTRKVRLKRKFLSAYFKDNNLFTDFELGLDRSHFNRLKSLSLRLRSVTTEMTFMKSDIDNIQQQLSQILRDTRVRDQDAFDALGSLLSDSKSFEHRKIDEYVAECLECLPGPEGEEWTSILVFEDNCPEPYSEAIPGANPSRYQEYVKALTMYICDKLKHAGVSTDPISVFASLEQKILPRIFTNAISTIKKPNMDAVIQEKCRMLRGHTQLQIGIPTQFISSERLPYYTAICRFKSIVFSMTPTRIMQAISFAANDIHKQMLKVHPESVVGADAFLPIWVFCIIKANLPNLATLVQFLKGYLNPDLRYCEIGYYVTCLEGACVYIQDLPAEEEHPDKRYLMFDRERYKRGLPDREIFRYVEEITLTGYKLFLKKEFLTMAHKFYKCALLQTDDEEDRVLGCVVTAGQDLSNVQLEYFEKLLATRDHVLTVVEGGLLTVAVNTARPEGTHQPEHPSSDPSIISAVASLFTTRSAPDTPDAGWVHIASGDFSSVQQLLEITASLHRVGVWTLQEKEELVEKIAAGTVAVLPNAAYSRIAIKYGFALKEEEGVLQFLCEVQLLLRHLNYLSVFFEIDGVISHLTQTAVLAFQRDQNVQGEYVEALDETGVLCKDTYNRLRDILKQILSDLRKLGHQPSFNPLLRANEGRMRSFILNVQEELKTGVYIRGNFCSATRTTIHRHLYECEVAAWCNPYRNHGNTGNMSSSQPLP